MSHKCIDAVRNSNQDYFIKITKMLQLFKSASCHIVVPRTIIQKFGGGWDVNKGTYLKYKIPQHKLNYIYQKHLTVRLFMI